MTLFKQMAILFTIFLTLILGVVMVLNFKTATHFVQQQLATDAKNTAHSLGLSLSKVADHKDLSTMETMINAIFDSGYYESITLRDVEGKLLYERKNRVVVVDVPQWFIEHVEIQGASATSGVMSGWMNFGTLTVTGHTGNAYGQLYTTFKEMINSFMVMAMVILGALYALLTISLRSLKRIEDQAHAINRHEFLIQHTLPFTSEFRSVTLAMNSMVHKVQAIFLKESETLRQYHELLYRDNETNLYNRRYLTSKLPDYLHSDSMLCEGSYLLLSVYDHKSLKNEVGYNHYAGFLHIISTLLGDIVGKQDTAMVARLSEGDFMVILPSQGVSTLSIMAHHLMENLLEEGRREFGCSPHGVCIAAGAYTHEDTIKSLFSKADQALLVAISKGDLSVHVESELPLHKGLVLGRDEWRDELKDAMEHHRLILAGQDVLEGEEVYHKEIFLRLKDIHGEIYPAGYFMPVAAHIAMTQELDRYVIREVLQRMREGREGCSYGINLGADFVKNSANRSWLAKELDDHAKHITHPLFFESTNVVAVTDTDAFEQLAMVIKERNHFIGIDQFVVPEEGVEYLQAIKPHYIKVNVHYLMEMFHDVTTGQKREGFNIVAQSLGITLIAVNVETQEEFEGVNKLGIDLVEGRYVADSVIL